MKKTVLLISLLCQFLISCNSVDNSITVAVDDGLDLNAVKIQYGFYSGNEKSDKKLVEEGLDKTVFENNKARSFKTICGENDFLVTYQNEYYVKVRHFIPNDFYNGIPESHEYNFELKNDQNGLLLILNIVGLDGEIITAEFAEITQTK